MLNMCVFVNTAHRMEMCFKCEQFGLTKNKNVKYNIFFWWTSDERENIRIVWAVSNWQLSLKKMSQTETRNVK